ncbi:MAG: MFS transporter, partial [Boseongicola sp.]|nr:MFS transporter [Boseongicola sp.]
FGVANGLGYGFSLQYAARANPNHSGVAMGIVTAAYALGAAVSPRAFVAMLEFGEFFGAMALLATATALACAVAAWFVWRAELPFEASSDAEAGAMPSVRTVVRTWLAYGLGVAAGLMAIGHAAGIASLAGITPWLAPAVLAVCNLVGSLIGGLLVDRFSPRRLLPLIPLISVLGLVMLAFSPAITLFALGLVGLAYGCTISAYPAVIAKDYPGSSGPRVYGLVFTAWGAAGLAAPWLAGALFDQTQSYSSALWIAAVLAATSSVLAIRLSRR